MDDILVPGKLAVFVMSLLALDVPSLLQLHNSPLDGIPAFPADVGQAPDGVVPVLRQAQHLAQQPDGLQGKPRVRQVIVAHHRVVLVLLDTADSHATTSHYALCCA